MHNYNIVENTCRDRQCSGGTLWVHVDLLQLIARDPDGGGVCHHENGRYSSTIREVYMSKGFPAAVTGMLKKMCSTSHGKPDTASHVLLATCTKGMHRGDVYGRTIVEALNEITLGGERVFNAMLFPMSETFGVQAFLLEVWAGVGVWVCRCLCLHARGVTPPNERTHGFTLRELLA